MNNQYIDHMNESKNFNRTSLDFNGAGQKKIGGIARR